ncbi:hypothetical protein TNIN_300371 [Trichonephila inaurata madagascariensis]|uniref:Uncharacterized protein n=1 Tax=Trichonephila inaurata madagascariensis TaxID=2747483 RepID=A0A8X6YEL1_9ARAC|nr:hypothetical protein TNIN_300371 [Trichonephila inaurata madagascariensis]
MEPLHLYILKDQCISTLHLAFAPLEEPPTRFRSPQVYHYKAELLHGVTAFYNVETVTLRFTPASGVSTRLRRSSYHFYFSLRREMFITRSLRSASAEGRQTVELLSLLHIYRTFTFSPQLFVSFIF